MMSGFPLFVETYCLNGRVYRRNPYSGSQPTQVINGGDTADLYEEYEDDEPVCGAPEYLPSTEDKDDVECLDSRNVDDAEPGSYTTPEVPTSSALGLPPGLIKHDKNVPHTSKPYDRPTQSEHLVFDPCSEDPRVCHAGNKWKAEVSVPHQFLSQLMGFQGKVKREMETATQCRVTVPSRGQKNKPVVINSTISLESVQRCLDRIEILVTKARAKASYTHFAAFPLTHSEIQETFKMFKEMVMCTDFISPSCKDETLFVSPSKLHLTLSMARLFTQEEIGNVKEAIKSAATDISSLLSGKQLVIDVQGISIMNDDPAQAHVLYANATGESVQEAANIVRDRLVSMGVSTPENGEIEDVKLHMTLMNSRKAAQAHNSHKRASFDAKSLLEEMKDFYFGTVVVDKLSLCVLDGSSAEGKDAFYLTVVDVNF